MSELWLEKYFFSYEHCRIINYNTYAMKNLLLCFYLFTIFNDSLFAQKTYLLTQDSKIINEKNETIAPGIAMYLYKSGKSALLPKGENGFLLKENTQPDSIIIKARVAALPVATNCVTVKDSTGKILAFDYWKPFIESGKYYLEPIFTQNGNTDGFVIAVRKQLNKAPVAVKESRRLNMYTPVIDQNCNTVTMQEASEIINQSGGRLKMIPIEYNKYLEPEKYLLAELPLFTDSVKNTKEEKAISTNNLSGSINVDEALTAVKKLENTFLPQFTLVDINGNGITSDNLRGKTVVINFWFKNCLPCIKEIPVLNKLVQEYKGRKDIVFIAVNSKDSKEDINEFLKKTPFEYNMVASGISTDLLTSQLKIETYPTHIVVDKTGKITYAGISALAVFEIKKLLAKS